MRVHDVVLDREKAAVAAFLRVHHLAYDHDIDDTIVIKEDGKIIATASSAKNVIKCVAVDAAHRGENLMARLIGDMVKRLTARGITHAFIFAAKEHTAMFESLGFSLIADTDRVALLESGGSIRDALHAIKREAKLDDAPKAAVVVNANPMTNGHLHLIKKAASEHDQTLVFVVSEDASSFPFALRYKIVFDACKDIPGVHVIPSGKYLVSLATFPTYFLKEEAAVVEAHAELDVAIFKAHYVPAFKITARYVGEEPFSPMTDAYNRAMKSRLGAMLTIIPRMQIDGDPISASSVRKILKTQPVEAIAPYVPNATLTHLKSREGKEAIDALRRRDTRH